MSGGTVNITLGNGNLGRASQTLDGVAALIGTGVAVEGKFALGDVLALNGLANAEAKGITAAYDLANKVLLWHHIRDFYANAGDGAELHVMPVANTMTFNDITGTPCVDILAKLKGRVRLLALTLVPEDGYEAIIEYGFDSDVWMALGVDNVIKIQFANHRPIQVLIEGRAFSGVAADARDLRDPEGLNANRVSIVIGQDNDVALLDPAFLNYAAVGAALGRMAAIPVQRNIGRVKDRKLSIVGVAGLSSGEKLSEYSKTDFNVLDTKGYIFMQERDGKAGYFFNNDHCACKIEDDYAYIHRGRPIDKAARIIYQVYQEELLDDVEVDAETGKLAVSTVKHFQRTAEKAIEINMLANGEISGVEVYVDADQNILATDTIEVSLNIIPKGMVNAINVKLQYKNPSIS